MDSVEPPVISAVMAVRVIIVEMSQYPPALPITFSRPRLDTMSPGPVVDHVMDGDLVTFLFRL